MQVTSRKKLPELEKRIANGNLCDGCYFASDGVRPCQRPEKYECFIDEQAIIWVIKKERG